MKEKEKSTVIETKNQRADKKELTGVEKIFYKIIGGGSKGLMYDIISDDECAVSGNERCITTDIVIPRYMDGYKVVEIGYEAFEGSVGMTSVKLHGGIKKIADRAFYDCTSLREIVIPEGVEEIGESAFSGSENNIWAEIGAERVVLPKSLRVIGKKAFYQCGKVKTLIIPGRVSRIEESTFFSCRWLETVSLPKDLTFIGKSAFSGCYSLQRICFAGTKEQWESIEKEDTWTRKIAADSVECVDGIVFLKRCY